MGRRHETRAWGRRQERPGRRTLEPAEDEPSHRARRRRAQHAEASALPELASNHEDPTPTGGKKRKKPFDVVTDSVLNSPRVLEKFDKQQLQSEQENDNNTTDSILATKKSKRRKSMARRVSFAPDHSLNKLCVYEKVSL